MIVVETSSPRNTSNRSQPLGSAASPKRILSVRSLLRHALIAIAALVLFPAQAQQSVNGGSRTGLNVSVPNGYATIRVDDMQVMGTAGQIRQLLNVWLAKRAQRFVASKRLFALMESRTNQVTKTILNSNKGERTSPACVNGTIFAERRSASHEYFS